MNNKPKSSPENILNKIPVLKGINNHSLKDQLIKEREISELIVNCLPGIFYLTDQSNKFLRWNKNLETITGYSGEEIEKMIPLDFFGKQDHEQIIEATKKVYKEGYNEIEVEIATKNGGQLLFHLNGISVIYEGKPCLLG